MAEFAISDNFGDYWQQYGLKQSPFEDYPQFAMYYPVAHWQPHLQFLQSFCRGENPILLLEGEFGIGKSMFISEAAAQLSQSVAIHQIKARASVTPTQLMHNIADGLQLPEVLSQPYLPQQIQLALAILQRTQKPCLLIIDDADLLPLDTLAALTHLAMVQQNKPVFLYIVLACELNLKNHIENIAKESQINLMVNSLELEPLSLEETKNYLKHRLSKAGLNGKMPFNKEIIQHIHELSGGVPGRINRVAQQTLIDLLKPDAERIPLLQQQQKNFFSMFKGSTVKITSLLLLVLLVLVYWKMQQREHILPYHVAANNAAVTTAPVAATKAQIVEQLNLTPATPVKNTAAAPAIDPNAAATAAAAALQQDDNSVQQRPNAIPPQISAQNAANPQQFRNAETQVIEGNKPQQNPALLNNNVASNAAPSPAAQNTAAVAVAPAAAVNDANNAASAAAAVATDTTAVASNNSNVADTNNAANSIAATDANAVPPVAVTPNNATQEIKPSPTQNSEVVGEKKEEKTDKEILTKTEKRLMGLEGYTLQLIASRNVSDLKRYMKANNLSANQAMEFQTQLNGKPWYVLVYGNYASQQQAKDALKQMISRSHKGQGWVRPMSSVHTAINEK